MSALSVSHDGATRAPRRPVRLGPVVATEVRLHVRHGVVASVAALSAVWVGLLLALPAGVRAPAVPWVLFLDLATLGFFFVPALAVVERGNGVTAALRVTRLAPSVAITVRVTLLAVWSALAAVLVAAAGGLGWAPAVVGGAVLTAGLFALLAVVMVGGHESLLAYLPRVPAVGVPLLAPALVHGIGLWDGAVLWLSPATGALDLLAGRWSWTAAAWIVVWIVGLGAAAVRIGFTVRPASAVVTQDAAPRTRRAGRPLGSGTPWAAVRSLARADRRTLSGDAMLVLVALGIPLLAGGIRLATGPGVTWVQARYGVDLAPWLPVLWALVVVVHAPMMAGTLCGMLFLEDRDAHLLPALAATRAGLRTLVTYRFVATAVATAAAVVVALVIAGARHAAGAGGLAATAVVGASVSLVPAAVMAARVRDRVAGMAVVKALGLPLYLPLAWWFVHGPAGWAFLVVPTGWAVRAFWATSLPAAAGFAAGGVAVSLAYVALLLPGLRRSVAV